MKPKLRGAAFFFAGVAATLTVFLAVQAARGLPSGYSPYRKLNLFARVLTYVENNYVEYVDDSKLIYGAIKGMLASLEGLVTGRPKAIPQIEEPYGADWATAEGVTVDGLNEPVDRPEPPDRSGARL